MKERARSFRKSMTETAHHADTDVVKYDQRRTEFLEKKGYKVFRVWSHEVFENIDGILEFILNELEKVPS